jgi:uncharacterized glyoxalase superfamily protein PhnB
MTAKRKAAKTARKRKKGALPARAAAPQPGSGVAPGMQTVNSYLAVANVGAAIQFLERAFGFARGVVLPDADGQLRYAEMRHGDSVIMLIRKGDTTTASGGAAALYTYVNDVDRVMAQAREAGAGVGEAEEKPWGDRVAVVTDPDGYRWVLATFKKLAPFS